MKDITIKIPSERAVRISLLLQHLTYKSQVKGSEDLKYLERVINNSLSVQEEPEKLSEMLSNLNTYYK